MAEFVMYGAPEDWDNLLSKVFSVKNLCLIPDIFYPAAKASCYRKDCIAFRKAFATKRGAFIKGSFTSHPIAFSHIPGEGYAVDQLVWGPLLMLFLPLNEMSSEGILLRPGDLSYQSAYFSQDRSVLYRPSRSLKAAYAELKALFSRQLARREIGARIHIGNGALRCLYSGQAKILVRGEWWTYRKAVARRDNRVGF